MERDRSHILLILVLGLSACTTFERDPRSGYGGELSVEAPIDEFYQDRDNQGEADARDELGFGNRALSDAESAQLEDRLRLHRMESKLVSQRDRKQYYSIRWTLKNDRERMGFLSLPDYETKQRWLTNRGLLKQDESYPDAVAKAIESNDIALGMSQKGVRESWGDPDLVESAGDPMYGFERWNYHRFVAGAEGYQKELRIVYFEGGRVVGWETPN